MATFILLICGFDETTDYQNCRVNWEDHLSMILCESAIYLPATAIYSLRDDIQIHEWRVVFILIFPSLSHFRYNIYRYIIRTAWISEKVFVQKFDHKRTKFILFWIYLDMSLYVIFSHIFEITNLRKVLFNKNDLYAGFLEKIKSVLRVRDTPYTAATNEETGCGRDRWLEEL